MVGMAEAVPAGAEVCSALRCELADRKLSTGMRERMRFQMHQT
jgi:hypothetical protein